MEWRKGMEWKKFKYTWSWDVSHTPLLPFAATKFDTKRIMLTNRPDEADFINYRPLYKAVNSKFLFSFVWRTTWRRFRGLEELSESYFEARVGHDSLRFCRVVKNIWELDKLHLRFLVDQQNIKIHSRMLQKA